MSVTSCKLFGFISTLPYCNFGSLIQSPNLVKICLSEAKNLSVLFCSEHHQCMMHSVDFGCVKKCMFFRNNKHFLRIFSGYGNSMLMLFRYLCIFKSLPICSGQDKNSLQWELWSGKAVAKIQTVCFSLAIFF